jgi:hypothetical protein
MQLIVISHLLPDKSKQEAVGLHHHREVFVCDRAVEYASNKTTHLSWSAHMHNIIVLSKHL